MFQHRVGVVVFLIIGLIFSHTVISQAQDPQSISPHLVGKIDPRLLKLIANDENARAKVMIEMHQKADLQAAHRQPDLLARRTAIVHSLQATAEQAQAEVLALLSAGAARQTVSDIQPLWVVNSIAATLDWSMVLTLASRADVDFVRLEETIQLAPLPEAEIEANRASDSVEWGIAHVQAPLVWDALGIDGTGVVVASMDTGVDQLHPDLRTRYRGYNGETLPPLHAGHWFDATDTTTYPNDGHGHGTHTVGTILGGNGIGVAPGAAWIAVKIFDNDGFAQEHWIHAGFQWLLAPNGDPALAPQVVNNSWGNDNGELFKNH